MDDPSAAARARDLVGSPGGEPDPADGPRTPGDQTPPPARSSGLDYPISTPDGTGTISLAVAPDEDYEVLVPIIDYLEEDELDREFAAGLCGPWLPYDIAGGLHPDETPQDAWVYKIVEEDAWLSVLFGPPHSEFFIDFHLAVANDGGYEVIEWEPVEAW